MKTVQSSNLPNWRQNRAIRQSWICCWREKKSISYSKQASNGEDALELAIKNPDPEVFKTLIAMDCFNNKKYQEGRLLYLAANQSYEKYKLLRNKYPDDTLIDYRDKFGQNALHKAASNSTNSQILEDMLHEGKVDLNSTDKSGRLPIDFAARNAKTGIKTFEFLLNLTAKNAIPESVLSSAEVDPNHWTVTCNL